MSFVRWKTQFRALKKHWLYCNRLFAEWVFAIFTKCSYSVSCFDTNHGAKFLSDTCTRVNRARLCHINGTWKTTERLLHCKHSKSVSGSLDACTGAVSIAALMAFKRNTIMRGKWGTTLASVPTVQLRRHSWAAVKSQISDEEEQRRCFTFWVLQRIYTPSQSLWTLPILWIKRHSLGERWAWRDFQYIFIASQGNRAAAVIYVVAIVLQKYLLLSLFVLHFC